MHFADFLLQRIDQTSPICVGIDPVLDKIPSFIKDNALEECWDDKLSAAWIALAEFWIWIIDAMSDLAWVVKPQLAYFEQYWYKWIEAYEEICAYAKNKWHIVIADAKRWDIWPTSEAYANAFLWEVDIFWESQSISSADAVTVNPYLWSDWVLPFVEVCKKHQKWIFVLVKTSNPSAHEFQDLPTWEELVCEEVARHVSNWWMNDLWERHFSSVWAVVWATYGEDARYLRSLLPNQIFLVPGFWAQWWDENTIRNFFNDDWAWAIINSSRSVNYAYLSDKRFNEEQFIEAAHEEIKRMKEVVEKNI